jgi:4-carboxymuconolactone decarboxylase
MEPSDDARVPLISGRDRLDPDARAVFDRIVESRGALLRPFEVLLHSPAIADQVAALGHVVRFGSHLADADRELATVATGRATGCAFVWTSHLDAARSAGVEPDTLAAIDVGGVLDGRERALVEFVRELCATGRVSDESFRGVHDLLGTQGTVELALTVGYYMMLGAVMGAVETC